MRAWKPALQPVWRPALRFVFFPGRAAGLETGGTSLILSRSHGIRPGLSRLGCGIRSAQLARKKVGAGVVGADPIAAQQEVVDFVGKDKFLEFNLLTTESFDELDGLGERHVAVVVAVD